MKCLLRNTTYPFFVVCMCVFVACMPAGCAHGWGSGGGLSYSHYQDLKEIEIGKKIHAEVLAQSYPYTEPGVNGYLRGIFDDIVVQAERAHLPYTLTILYDERIYANSAPGGFVYITTGMINYLENEAELAAVLAHEVARIQYREPSISEGKRVMELLKVGTSLAAPLLGPYGALVVLGLQGLDRMFFYEKSQRERTFMADEEALRAMSVAGYNPQGYTGFHYKVFYSAPEIKVLQAHYLASHELTAERLERMNGFFEALPQPAIPYIDNTQRFMEITKPVRAIYR